MTRSRSCGEGVGDGYLTGDHARDSVVAAGQIGVQKNKSPSGSPPLYRRRRLGFKSEDRLTTFHRSKPRMPAAIVSEPCTGSADRSPVGRPTDRSRMRNPP